MASVDSKAPVGQETDPSITPAPARRPLICCLRVAFVDIKAVVEDPQRPLRQRRLGPVEAERITREAFVSIEKALAYAEGNSVSG